MGKESAFNPFCAANMPFTIETVGSRLVEGATIEEPNLLLKGIDANLGVDGLPQSATGQTALFTGQNASKILGHHLTAFPNRELVDMINAHSLLKLAKEKGLRSVFANMYTPNYFQLAENGLRFHSVTTHCVFAAKLPFLFVADMLRGNAVYWDMTNRFLVEKYKLSVPIISPELAGERLANISKSNDLVLYECFLSDLIGHKQNHERALEFLKNFDNLIKEVVKNMEDNTTLLITSDHGNIEDLSIKSHTYNPVPLFVIGPKAGDFAHVDSITGVMDACF